MPGQRVAANWTFEAREVNRDKWWQPAVLQGAEKLDPETSRAEQRPVVDISRSAAARETLPGP